MSVWLITGGAGFIGANFVFFLLEKRPKDRIVILDKLTYAGNLSTLSPVLEKENVRFIRGDIADRETVEAVFEEEKPDILVNFAAESHVDRSIDDPAPFLQTNLIGTGVLLDVCVQKGIRRFHQISTDEVYGEIQDAGTPSVDENAPLRPGNPYAASKAAADLLILSYRRTYSLPVSISRCSNNFGRYQFPEKLIPRMVIRALKGKTLPLFGNGEDIRDWISVSDHCRAVFEIIEKGQEGEIYNIGGGNERSNRTVVEAICRLTGCCEEKIVHTPDRKGHDRRYSLNAEKLRALGWVPEETFEETLAQTVTWYRENRSWWEPLLARDFWPEWAREALEAEK